LLLTLALPGCTEPPADPKPDRNEQGSGGVDGLGGDKHLGAIYGGGGMQLRFLGSEGAILEEIEIAGVPQDGLWLTGDALSVSAGDPSAPTTSTPETEAYLDEAAWMWYYVEEEIEVMGCAEPLSAYCESGEECGKVGVSFTFRADPNNTDAEEPLIYELALVRVRLGTVSGCAVDVVHQDPELANAEPMVGRDQIFWGSAWVAHCRWGSQSASDR
jgi:hypothetical protein